VFLRKLLLTEASQTIEGLVEQMKTKLATLSLILVIFLSAVTVAGPVNSAVDTTQISNQTVNGTDAWPMFGYNAAHTGSPDDIAPQTYDLLWRRDIDAASSFILGSSPAIVNGVVYVGSDDGSCRALNASTGTQIWNQMLGDFTPSSPSVVDGVVYISMWDYKDYALNASTGSIIWNCTRGGLSSSTPAIANGLFYVCGGSGEVIARKLSTGDEVWSYTYGGNGDASPVIVGDTVYVSEYGSIYALNALSGALKWSYFMELGVTYNSPTVSNGFLYCGSEGQLFYALNASTGQSIWNYTTGPTDSTTPTVAYGTVFVGTSNKGIYALNATTGEKIWTNPNNVWCSSLSVAGGQIYVCNSEGIHALSASTGTEYWSYNLGNENINSSPAISNGVLYVRSAEGFVYAFGKAAHPSIVLNPLVGLSGSFLNISGSGFTADSTVSVTFNQQNLPISYNGVGSLGQPFGTIIVPSIEKGKYTITVTDTAGESASANFTVVTPPTTAWPTLQQNPQRSGSSDGISLVNNSILWRASVDRGGTFTMNSIASSPAIVGGIVYFTAMNSYLYAYDAFTGERYWRFDLNGISATSSPTVANGVVYVGAERGVYAIDAYTGEKIWFYSGPLVLYSTPTVSNGIVYIGSFAENAIYALRASDGQLLWSYATGDYVIPSTAVVGNSVYVGSYDCHIYSLNAQTGGLQWKFNCSNQAGTPTIFDGVAYAASTDGNVYALNANTGEKIWNHTTGYRVASLCSPSVKASVVYVPTGSGVYALDTQTGAELWHFGTADAYFTLSIVLAEKEVYFTFSNGTLFALDSVSGEEKWCLYLGSTVRASSGLANGVLYVGTANGDIIAIGTPQEVPAPTATPTPTPTSTTTQTSTSSSTTSSQHTTATTTPTLTPSTAMTPSPNPNTTQSPTKSPGYETTQSSTPFLIAAGISGTIILLGSIGWIRYKQKNNKK
jgi:eukaryotic-like serine/threonine-protein kinase